MCLLLVAMDEVPSYLMLSVLLLLHFLFMLQGILCISSTASVGTHVAEVGSHCDLLPCPGPTEKGKAMALRCIWTILETRGPARRYAQFHPNLMPWLILFSQRKLIKCSVSPLSA